MRHLKQTLSLQPLLLICCHHLSAVVLSSSQLRALLGCCHDIPNNMLLAMPGCSTRLYISYVLENRDLVILQFFANSSVDCRFAKLVFIAKSVQKNTIFRRFGLKAGPAQPTNLQTGLAKPETGPAEHTEWHNRNAVVAAATSKQGVGMREATFSRWRRIIHKYTVAQKPHLFLYAMS